YTENLSISFSLRIVGSGSATTIIDGGGTGTVVGISNATAHVTLAKLTIRNGFAPYRAGISNAGILTINNSIISRNVATSTKGAGSGGGIANSGTATINNSNIYGNSVYGEFAAGFGGGFYNTGTATINNSTFNGNIAAGRGGGSHNQGGNLTITNSTLTGNSASYGGGGGIYNYIHASMAINNCTIIAN